MAAAVPAAPEPVAPATMELRDVDAGYGPFRAIFGVSAFDTVVVPLRPRFRFLVLLVRMCWLNALPRLNFPFLVRLKRFAAPRWVFSLIFFAFFAILFLLCNRGARRDR